MHKYLPNTQEDIKKMLKTCNVNSIEELFIDIPKEVAFKREMNIEGPLSELEIEKKLGELSGKNYNTKENICFLGAGAYDHYIPSAIKHITSRSEFSTTYTPYQPEVSQGTLQAIFEYQTMICNLTDMEVSNASLYDGGTATAEAMFITCDITRRKKILVSKTVNPQTREIVKTYSRFKNIEYVEIEEENGQIDLKSLKKEINDQVAGVLVQNPNFFGIIEDYTEIEKIIHENKSQFVVNCDPISLGLLKTPREQGADIAVGEGQSLGTPLSFGGPYLGFIATKDKNKRKLPGRIVGQTKDVDGKRGYVLTLQAREQHIRREKATSNITSNQALVALSATIYMSLMGDSGIKEVAENCLIKTDYAIKELKKTRIAPLFNQPVFKEFVIKIPETINIETLNSELLKDKIIGGYNIGKDYKKYKNGYMICITEKRTKEEIDLLITKIGEIINGIQ